MPAPHIWKGVPLFLVPSASKTSYPDPHILASSWIDAPSPPPQVEYCREVLLGAYILELSTVRTVSRLKLSPLSVAFCHTGAKVLSPPLHRKRVHSGNLC